MQPPPSLSTNPHSSDHTHPTSLPHHTVNSPDHTPWGMIDDNGQMEHWGTKRPYKGTDCSPKHTLTDTRHNLDMIQGQKVTQDWFLINAKIMGSCPHTDFDQRSVCEGCLSIKNLGAGTFSISQKHDIYLIKAICDFYRVHQVSVCHAAVSLNPQGWWEKVTYERWSINPIHCITTWCSKSHW